MRDIRTFFQKKLTALGNMYMIKGMEKNVKTRN